MVKPMRKGRCPHCRRPTKRQQVIWKDGSREIFQPYCARCAERRRYGPGWYLKMDERVGAPGQSKVIRGKENLPGIGDIWDLLQAVKDGNKEALLSVSDRILTI
jgi:hypothetical protein